MSERDSVRALEWHFGWYDMDVLAMGMTGFRVKVSLCALSSRMLAFV